MSTLITSKVKQAIQILQEKGIDLWLTFVRETSAFMDPVLPLIYGTGLTWESALILTRDGTRLAIVGRLEAEAARRTGAYREVIPYDESITPVLIGILNRLDPARIAINYSLDDPVADGLSHGMYLQLVAYLQGTPYLERLVSAEELIGALKGRKTGAEVDRIRGAIKTTNEIYKATFQFIQPGMTEKEIAAFMHDQIRSRGLQPAWDWEHCPTVNAGPDSPVGHVGPTDIQIEPGQLLHFDFGVKQNDYCADIQRVVYFLAPGEIKPPPLVEMGFKTIVQAIQASVDAMVPGITGVEIDRIARSLVTKAGYPEYKYATGHHLGRSAHDGGGILGPLWERYGNSPNRPLEAGHVYTVEPGIPLPDYGYIGIEEDVWVTENGTIYLGPPQKELVVI